MIRLAGESHTHGDHTFTARPKCHAEFLVNVEKARSSEPSLPLIQQTNTCVHHETLTSCAQKRHTRSLKTLLMCLLFPERNHVMPGHAGLPFTDMSSTMHQKNASQPSACTWFAVDEWRSCSLAMYSVPLCVHCTLCLLNAP